MNKRFEEYRFDMIETITKNHKFDKDGIAQTNIDSLFYYKTETLSESSSIMYEPSLCVILQGSKAVGFGTKLYKYDHTEYLLASAHVPADIKILEASKKLPYVSLVLRFKLEDVFEVLKNTDPKKLKAKKKTEKGLFIHDMDIDLYDSISRLVKLTEKTNEDVSYLSSLVEKEILFNLINGDSGYFLNKFAMEGTASNKIVKAISEIKSNFNEKLNMKDLARLLDISESSLYQNFKTITSMSPVQFQKKLRLEEAKNMLSKQNLEASEVAFAVGYESPSQFSREYSRMFGMSPKAHSELLKNQMYA